MLAQQQNIELNRRFLKATGRSLPNRVGTFSGVIPDDDQSHVVWLTANGEYRVSSMDDLSQVCDKPARTWQIRDAEMYSASIPLEIYLDSRKEASDVNVSTHS